MTKQSTKVMLVMLISMALIGCQGSCPDTALQLSPDSMQNRELQSRKFSTLDEPNMLSASMEVLQDMGFMINESDSKLGVIVGSKVREIDNRAQRYTLVALNILAGTGTLRGIEQTHKIRVSLVTIPDKSKKDTTVRVNFQREVTDMEGNLVKLESVHEKELYTGFFEKLSKSVFLEAHKI